MPQEKVRKSAAYGAYRKYFRSKIIVFMLAAVMFHVLILFCEAVYCLYMSQKLGRGEAPGHTPLLLELMRKTGGMFETQKSIETKSVFRRLTSILSKLIDFLVVLAFFSHPIRDAIMGEMKKHRSFIRINCSHIKEHEVNFLVLAIFVLSTKTIVLEWLLLRRSKVSDLLLNLAVNIFRCTIVAPLLIWLFSSVYNKTNWGLVVSAYAAAVTLIILVNCTEILPEPSEDYEVIPHEAFHPKVQSEIQRLGLRDRIFWDQTEEAENAALVKTGASRYIVVMGNLLKYGKQEFLSFITHEIGHADDQSTEKKLLATILSMGLTCAGLLLVLHFIGEKYTEKGVSRSLVLSFVILGNIYIMSSIINMFHNNLGILSEVNADLYAKHLGLGEALARGLFKLTADNNVPLFHFPIYTHYAQDHPSIATRIAYLTRG